MPNIFDQFDVPQTTPAETGNIFDQFDAVASPRQPSKNIPPPPPGFELIPPQAGGYDAFSSPLQPSVSDYDAFSSPVYGPSSAPGAARKNIPPPPPGFELVAPLAHPRTFERPEDEQLYRQKLAEIRSARSRPQVPFYAEGIGGEHNLTAEDAALSPEHLAIRQVQEQRAREQEQAGFEASRTPFRRVVDPGTFLLSGVTRAATRGEYGLGDVISKVSPTAGRVYSQQEQEFARANKWWLQRLAQTGEVAMGIPPLAELGAVPGEMLRTTGAALESPALKAAPRQTYNLARRAAFMKPTEFPPPRPSAPRAAPVATPAQAYGPAERMIDRAAFQAEGIPEFPPAFGSKGMARTARTIEETPLVGGTVKVPKTAVEQAMAERQRQIAASVGAAASPEDVGRIAQSGLSRFRGNQLQNLDQPSIDALNQPGPIPGPVQPITTRRAPAQRVGYVDINKPSRLDTANMTPAQLKAAARSEVNLPGSTRATIEDLSPAEVQRIVNLPARDTSFATKASALYRQADDALPPLMRTDETANANLVATRNSDVLVEGLLKQEKSSAVSGGMLQGRFGPLIQRLNNAHSNFPLASLRAARTEIGRALSSFGEFDTRLDRTQLKQLYGAISDDYQAGLVALAARARQASKLPPTAKNYVSPSVADAADRALQRYRVADRYYRSGIERMDRFMQVLGADTLEQASRKIGQYLRENTQNVRALESMASSLRPEEWKAVLGNVIANLGKLTPGAKESEKIFAFERYATDWNKISQNPRVLAMFRKAFGDTVVKSLQNMGRIAERMKYYETTKNYSGAAYTAFGGATLATLWNPVAWPLLIGGVAGTGVAGKVLTSQKFAAWVNSLNRAQVKVGSSVAATKAALRPHLQRLFALAKKEPDPEVAQAMQALGYVIDRQIQAATRPRTGQ